MTHRPDDLPAIPLRAAPLRAVAGTSVAAMLLALGIAAVAHGQAPAVDAQAAGAAAAPAAAAPADSESLSGTFIDVRGKVQWRSGPDAPWQAAKVNDVIASGAEVRSGLNSHAALKLGSNATALIDAGTMFQVPTVVREGDVLRTVVAVKSGRADFKVDKVGLSNDFKVVTPSTTLAVRGTGFAVATGALKQVEVLGARRNAINAIQLKYALTNTTVQMSGGAASSSSVQQPTHNALVSTAPPTTAGALPSTNATETVVQAAVGQSPANAGSPANNQQGNTATTKSQNSVAVVTDAKTDGNGIVAQINRALIQRGADAVAEADRTVADARSAVDAAIQLLLADLGEQDLIDANVHALEKLRALAVARRNAALLALDRLEIARGELDGPPADTVEVHAHEFDRLAGLLVGPDRDQPGPPAAGSVLGEFDDERGNLQSAVTAINDFVDAEDSVPGSGSSVTGDIEQVARDAASALAAMGDALDDGRGLLVALAGEQLSVDAQEAVVAYHRAIDGLARAASTGASAERVARQARDAVDALSRLVAELAVSRPGPELEAHARAALGHLRSAEAGLTDAARALARVAELRIEADALDDPRKALLSNVSSSYASIVAIRTRLLAEWASYDQMVTAREPELQAGVDATEDAFHRLAQLGLDRTTGHADEAEQALGEVEAERIAVEQGVSQVLADAESFAASVAARSAAAEGSAVESSVLLEDALASGSSAVDALVGSGAFVQRTVLDFESVPIPEASGALPSFVPLAGTSVGGFSWSGQPYVYASGTGQNGYTSGIVSGSQGAFNGYGSIFTMSRDEPWTLEGAYFTPAWQDGLQIVIEGYLGSTLVGRLDQTLGSTLGPPMFVSVGFAGITSAVFRPLSTSSQFAMDDLRWLVPGSGYDPQRSVEQAAALTQAASHMESMGAAIRGIADRRADAVAQRDGLGETWGDRADALVARGRDALQSILAAADSFARAQGSAGRAATDAAEIAAAVEGLRSLALDLEAQFGASHGFSASVIAGVPVVSTLNEEGGAPARSGGLASESAVQSARAALALSEISSLREQADDLARRAVTDPDLDIDAWRAGVHAALLAAQQSVQASVDSILDDLDEAVTNFRLDSGRVLEAMSDHASDARAAAAIAADEVDSASLPVAPLRALQVELATSEARATRTGLLLDDFDARTDGFDFDVDNVGLGLAGLANRPVIDLASLSLDATLMDEAERLASVLDGLDAKLMGPLSAQQRAPTSELAADVSASALAGLRAQLDGPAGLIARAEEALEAILASPEIALAAEAASESANDSAQAASGAAQAARSAALRVRDVAVDLENRLGTAIVDADAARAASEAVAAAALQAEAAAERAQRGHAALVGQLTRLSGDEWKMLNDQLAIATTIRAYLDDALEDAGGAEGMALSALIETYRDINETGAIGYADLTVRSHDAIQSILADASRVAQPLDRLSSIAIDTAAVADALDGAESAAGRAETAFGQAMQLREIAEARKDDALVGRDRAIEAVGRDDLMAAGGHRDFSVVSADLSRGAADLSAIRAVESQSHRDAALDFQSRSASASASILVVANAARPAGTETLSDFGQGFEQAVGLAVSTDAARVTAASGAAATLRDQAAFFDGVAATLAGRADTATASLAAGASAEARAIALSAAQELASHKQSAQRMADTASTNAGRLLGRSMLTYVTRAEAAATSAAQEASRADAAAVQARAYADAAIEAVAQAGLTPPPTPQ